MESLTNTLIELMEEKGSLSETINRSDACFVRPPAAIVFFREKF